MKFKGEYKFLSNMYQRPVKFNGKVYPCAETAFQAQKSDWKDFVINGSFVDGYMAKSIGRRVKLRSDWEFVKLEIMKDIIRAKFSDETLKRLLLSVEGEIVEDNTWHDTFWGVCDGKGENHLGKILMEVREELKSD